jgi:dynein heavy chain
VNIFLKGGASLDAKSERSKPFTWLSDKIWLNIIALSKHHFCGDPLAFFRDLPESLQRNEGVWKQWVDRNDPEGYPIPDFHERI